MKIKLIITLLLCLFAINCNTQADEAKNEQTNTSNKPNAELNNQAKPSPAGQSNESNDQPKTPSDGERKESGGEVNIPAEVKPFIKPGTKAIAVESADLNGDTKKDYILVLEKLNPEKGADDMLVNQRPLLILVRDEKNNLAEVKRNEKMVMCSECGGMMGDPFEGVKAGEKTFTITHYGGSGMRWSAEYKFNYSRIDKTWQLVEVKRESFSATGGDDEKTSTVLTPKDFGKVDIADFDPDKLPEN